MSRHYHRKRNGFTLAELLVAATLLIAGLAFVTQGTVQTKRLIQDTRRYNLAIDELSNQLERLTAMASPEREKAMTDLQPSEAIRSILTDVSLEAEELRDNDGNRISISIQWDRGGPAAPLTLVGWIVPPTLNLVAERREPSGEVRETLKEPDGSRRSATRKSP